MRGEDNLTFLPGVPGIAASPVEWASWVTPLGMSQPWAHTQDPGRTLKTAVAADISGSRTTTGS